MHTYTHKTKIIENISKTIYLRMFHTKFSGRGTNNAKINFQNNKFLNVKVIDIFFKYQYINNNLKNIIFSRNMISIIIVHKK